MTRDPVHAGKERTTSINSCLCPIGSLHGASITTVEGIGNSKAGFHPVQGSRSHLCDLCFKNLRRAIHCNFCIAHGMLVLCLHFQLCQLTPHIPQEHAWASRAKLSDLTCHGSKISPPVLEADRYCMHALQRRLPPTMPHSAATARLALWWPRTPRYRGAPSVASSPPWPIYSRVLMATSAAAPAIGLFWMLAG